MSARPRRIVVGYDGSDASVRALDVAADLVGYGSSLAVLTVLARESDHELTAHAREQLQGRLVQAGYHEATGEPAAQLVEKADEFEADLIVIGRGNGRPTLGSVSSEVVSRATCDVLVVGETPTGRSLPGGRVAAAHSPRESSSPSASA